MNHYFDIAAYLFSYTAMNYSKKEARGFWMNILFLVENIPNVKNIKNFRIYIVIVLSLI